MSERRTLLDDNRGAVMMTGLFMSCFLCGALWFIIGIGDAINFRDSMQEAADHGAFTAAAFNAKGMNFIALCNLVMLAGTLIHIVLGVITDVAGAIYAACFATCFVGVGCTCVIPAYRAWSGLFRAWDAYFNTAVKRGFPLIHDAQKVASYAYPVAGSVNAFEVGVTYDNPATSMNGQKRMETPLVVAMSASMVPTGPLQALADRVGNKIFKPETPKAGVTKEGFLPVEPRKYEELCLRLISVASKTGLDLVGVGAGNNTMNGDATSIFNNVIGGGLQWRYCNKSRSLPFLRRNPTAWMPFPVSGHGGGMDSFWGEIGWYRVYQPAKNGTLFFQSWAGNVMPVLHDTSDHIVENAGKKPTAASGGGTSVTEFKWAYFSQAEMYFDCNEEWGELACNFEDYALLAIKWRARLRKLDFPALGSGIIGSMLSAIVATDVFKTLDKGAGAWIAQKLGKIFGNNRVIDGALNKAADAMLDMFERYIRGDLITKKLGPLLDPSLGGVYH